MGWRERLPAVPHIHFMAAAPLDAWVRLLLTPGVRVGWRYWPRVLVNLALSACVTAITLPERVLLAPVLWWRGRRSGWRLGSGRTSPPALVVLGYYRTGTTHLHNLLSCDPGSHTPRWGQVLAPQGFAASWFVLKLFLWAVLPTKRPQDDMAFGPEWPGEDDFALSNWTLASPLAGRVVLPDSYAHFRRFHDLEGLTTRERARWRRTQWAILWKIRLLGRGRRLLLKTPPHTARVPALTEVLGGPAGAKFIHLSRDPAAVLKSNQRLMAAMTPFHLQDGPGEEAIRERLAAEYEATERRFAADEGSIPPGHVVRMRYEDLIADPVGQLRRAYGALGLEWTEAFERRLGVYLESVREYRSETQKIAEAPTTAPGPEKLRPRSLEAPVVAAMGAAALVSLLVWIGVVWASGHRSAIFAMLAGLAIGHSATARRAGTIGRGVACVVACLAVSCVGMTMATWLADFPRGAGVAWPELVRAAWRRLTHESTLLWISLGAVAAFRLGSRRFGAVPGR